MQNKTFHRLIRIAACLALAIQCGRSFCGQAENHAYQGAPAAIPGLIQTVKFDEGGEGAAYHKKTKSADPNPIRSGEGITTQACKDEGGGFNIGNLNAGDWLNYTVNVTAAGNYDIEVRTGTGAKNPGGYHLEIDGKDITGTVTVSATGNGQAYETAVAKINVPLNAGLQVLRLCMDRPNEMGSIGNFNWIRFSAAETVVKRGADGGALVAPEDPARKAQRLAAVKTLDPEAPINELMRQEDSDARDKAIAMIRAMPDQRRAATGLRNAWLKLLLEVNRNADAADLSQWAILAEPDDTPAVEDFLSYRIRALLALKKNADALSAAKQLFNVASMKKTKTAILLVSQCISAVKPDDRETLKKFRLEQMEAAQLDTAAAAKGASTPTMTAIVINPKPYDAAIPKLPGESYKSLMGRGNLMLMVGQCQPAKDVFELAYAMAETKDLAQATENLARCMKAEDGNSARANAWIESLRPKLQAANLQDLKLDPPTPAQAPAPGRKP